MSLALAAKHLESQGRNQDSKLVHMTPEELKALNKLSLDHTGKPLSVNPKTGLPEAGFLSSILPTVAGIAGAAMGLPTWAVIGGTGLLATALTGDIGQGIMAGLGAWGGTQLGADIAKASGAVQAGQNVATVSSDLAANAALDPSQYMGVSTNGLPATMGSNASTVIDTTGGLANIGSAGTKLAQGVNAAPLSSWDQFTKGWENVTKDPVGFLKQPGVGMHVAGAAIPPVMELLSPEMPQLNYEAPEKNPFGLKRLSPNFQGTFPAQPQPYYAATYPNYVTNPYTRYAKDGGLMDIQNYASGKKVDASRLLKSSEDVMSGIEMATKRPILQEPEKADVGIYADERKYANMDPYERALAVLKDIKGASGIPSRGLPNLKQLPSLGTISTDPAIIEAALAEQAQNQIAREAKSGGLMDGHLGDYSDGGRLLRGPGDGVSDSIPATIGGKQPARLAEGEFVIPARIVSELGNGSTDAGAKRLYDMMDRIKAKRRKAKDIAADTKAYKLLPA